MRRKALRVKKVSAGEKLEKARYPVLKDLAGRQAPTPALRTSKAPSMGTLLRVGVRVFCPALSLIRVEVPGS